MNDAFEGIWEEHRQYLRRLLIGLSRDIDLAEDLLQETYLRASAGISGYRGGDSRALTELDDVSRAALLMKHYCGFTYKDIAGRLPCPVGTAKWRVSAALDRLRVALGVVEVLTEMKCSELDGARLLDYVDARLAGRELRSVEAHLAKCPDCRSRVADIIDVVRALDATEADWAVTSIFELDANGGFTNYGWFSMPNTSDEPTEVFEFGHSGVTYMTIQGEEVHPEAIPGEDGKYRARLSHPIPPGQSIHHHAAEHHENRGASVRLDNGNWRFGPGRLHLTDPLLYVFAVRLPQGAVVVKPEPEAQEIRKNGTTTVIWRDTLPPDHPIELWLEYRL